MATISLGWRWAFLIQMPLFFVSFVLTSWNLDYVTPVSNSHILERADAIIVLYLQGKSKSTREVLKRIDYGGSFTLLFAVRTPRNRKHID